MRIGLRLLSCALVASLAAGVLLAAHPARTAGAPSPTVATVGSLKISASDLEARNKLTTDAYQERSGARISPELNRLLRRHALESLIRANLLILEAQSEKIPVSEADAESVLKQDPIFKANGVFDQTRFDAAKRNSPEVFQASIAHIKRELAARQLNERVQHEATADDERIRAEVARDMSRAQVSVLALREQDLGGEYPEPREKDVLAYYRSHPKEFHRTARAVLSVIEIPASTEAHIASARLRADSAIAKLRRGAPIENIARLNGLLRKNVTVLPDNFPGFWRGTADDARELFQLAPGQVLGHPVDGNDAVLVVRVDSSMPDRTAPLEEVASDIRLRLKTENGKAKHEGELHALYDKERTDLAAPAAHIRYAILDTSRVSTGDPDADDLDRYYRSHLSDYTSYDAAASAIRVQPFEEVRDQIRRRWREDQAMTIARDLTARLEAAWAANRRDRRLEGQAQVREVGPVPAGVPFGTDPAARAMATEFGRRPIAVSTGTISYDSGLIVYHIYDVDPRLALSFEQARPVLEAELKKQQDDEDLAGARALFNRDPSRFATGQVMHFSRIEIRRPDLVDVPLTRKEVERYHLEHISDYSAPERMRARHILVSPVDGSPEADAAAHAKAEGLLRRIRAGEDFAELARQYSDDPPTRSNGGDLGWFERGMMLRPFEDAAFKLRPGETSDVVKTQAGYHIIQCEDYQPLYSEPLVYLYQVVAMDAAREKGNRIARATADSLFSLIHTPADARAIAKKLGIVVQPMTHVIGTARTFPNRTRDMMMRLEKLHPGDLDPTVEYLSGVGALIQWVDSITPVKTPDFADVKNDVITAYRLEKHRQQFEAKQAEIDSLMHAWGSLDSVAALWGGVQKVRVRPGRGLPTIGEAGIVDSLVFGTEGHPPALAQGETSGWIQIRDGVMRLRVDEVRRPPASEVASHVASRRRLAVQQHLYDYFENLKKHHKVRILDPDLNGILLPRPRGGEDESAG